MTNDEEGGVILALEADGLFLPHPGPLPAGEGELKPGW